MTIASDGAARWILRTWRAEFVAAELRILGRDLRPSLKQSGRLADRQHPLTECQQVVTLGALYTGGNLANSMNCVRNAIGTRFAILMKRAGQSSASG